MIIQLHREQGNFNTKLTQVLQEYRGNYQSQLTEVKYQEVSGGIGTARVISYPRYTRSKSIEDEQSSDDFQGGISGMFLHTGI